MHNSVATKIVTPLPLLPPPLARLLPAPAAARQRARGALLRVSGTDGLYRGNMDRRAWVVKAALRAAACREAVHAGAALWDASAPESLPHRPQALVAATMHKGRSVSARLLVFDPQGAVIWEAAGSIRTSASGRRGTCLLRAVTIF